MSWAECATCGLVFASDLSFDKHRVGKYERYDKGGQVLIQPDARRCLSEEELVGRGWRQNRWGRWTHRAPRGVVPTVPEPAERLAGVCAAPGSPPSDSKASGTVGIGSQEAVA